MGSLSSRVRRHRRGAPHLVSSSVNAESEPSADALADLFFGQSHERARPGEHSAGAPGRDLGAEQLSAQVADALTLALADARDPLLRELVVVSVLPRRGAACLQVTLEVAPDRPIGEIQRRVERAVGWLRSEVADAIERKRVPDLVIFVVPEVAR